MQRRVLLRTLLSAGVALFISTGASACNFDFLCPPAGEPTTTAPQRGDAGCDVLRSMHVAEYFKTIVCTTPPQGGMSRVTSCVKTGGARPASAAECQMR